MKNKLQPEQLSVQTRLRGRTQDEMRRLILLAFVVSVEQPVKNPDLKGSDFFNLLTVENVYLNERFLMF